MSIRADEQASHYLKAWFSGPAAILSPRRHLVVPLIFVSIMVAIGCARSRPSPAVAPAERAELASPAPHGAGAGAGACVGSKPAPIRHPTAAPQPAAVPGAATATTVIRAVGDAVAFRRWLAAAGCRWAAHDGSEVLCWRRQQSADQRVTIALHVMRAPGVAGRRFVIYDAGLRSFSLDAVRPDALAAANAWLRARRARRGIALRTPVKITHNRFTLAWQGVHWGMPLHKPPRVAPTAKLGGREGMCCHWQPADAAYFEHCGLAIVRLALRCDWHQKKLSAHDFCYDTAWRPAIPQSAPAEAVHFVPVGSAIR